MALAVLTSSSPSQLQTPSEVLQTESEMNGLPVPPKPLEPPGHHYHYGAKEQSHWQPP